MKLELEIQSMWFDPDTTTPWYDDWRVLGKVVKTIVDAGLWAGFTHYGVAGSAPLAPFTSIREALEDMSRRGAWELRTAAGLKYESRLVLHVERDRLGITIGFGGKTLEKRRAELPARVLTLAQLLHDWMTPELVPEAADERDPYAILLARDAADRTGTLEPARGPTDATATDAGSTPDPARGPADTNDATDAEPEPEPPPPPTPPMFIGPTFILRPRGLDVPRPLPPSVDRHGRLQVIVAVASERFSKDHPLGGDFAKLGEHPVPDQMQRLRRGDMLAMRWGDTKSEDAVREACVAQERWWTGALRLPRHPDYNEAGDQRVARSALERRSDMLAYDRDRNEAFIQLKLHPDGAPDLAAIGELKNLRSSIGGASTLEVQRVTVVAPKRTMALRIRTELLSTLITPEPAPAATSPTEPPDPVVASPVSIEATTEPANDTSWLRVVWQDADAVFWDPRPAGNWLPKAQSTDDPVGEQADDGSAAQASAAQASTPRASAAQASTAE